MGNVLHGGCAMSLMDCNAIWTAIAARYEYEKRQFVSEPLSFYVTRAFQDSNLKHPIPLDTDHLHIISKALHMNEDSGTFTLDSWIVIKGVKLAWTKVIAVLVRPTQEETKKLLTPIKK